jgi:hypothetical protein
VLLAEISAGVQACDRVVVSSLFPSSDVHDNWYPEIHIENPTRCNCVSKYYFMYTRSSTCFGRHTTHLQEPKTALASSGFAYMEGCWTCSCRTLSGRQRPATTRPTTLHVYKAEAASAVLGSWWWAVCGPKHVELCVCVCVYIYIYIYKYEIKFWYTVASCWIFYVNCTMMQGSTNIKWYPTVSFLHSVK